MAKPPAMTGTALQDTVLDLCKMLGLRTAHFRPGLTRSGRWVTAVAGDGKGFLDLVIVGSSVLWREIKRDTNDPVTPDQTAWIATLRAAGQDADVWRPVDLRSGRIMRELTALRRPATARKDTTAS